MKFKFFLLFFLIVLSSCTKDDIEMTKEAQNGLKHQYLENEKNKLETAVIVYANKGDDITEKVIIAKEGQVLNANTTVKIKSIGIKNQVIESGLLFDNNKLFCNLLPKNESLVSEVVTLELSNSDFKTSLEVLVIFNPDKSKNKQSYYIPVELNSKKGNLSKDIKQDKTFLGVGYDVIHSSYINRDDAKLTRPVLDIAKLNKAQAIIQAVSYKTSWSSNTEESLTILHQTRYANVGVNIGLPLFSADFGVKYKQSYLNKKTNKYSYFRADHNVVEEFLSSSDPVVLRKYVTDDFINGIQQYSVSKILDTYGSHIFIRCYHGGNIESSFSYSGSQIKTTREMDAHVKARYKFITMETSSGFSNSQEDFNNNTNIYFTTKGGNNYTATNEQQILTKYEAWVNTIKENPDLSGIGNFDNSLLPIWKIISLVNPGKAKDVENEFNKRLKNRSTEITDKQNFINFINVWEQDNVSGTPQFPLTNYVMGSIYRTEDINVLDANRGARGDYIRLGYRLSPKENDNQIPIADIVILQNNNSTPNGYEKIDFDLNRNTKKKGERLYLAYRRVNSTDKEAIDYIGAHYGKNPPSTNLDLGWSWVMLYNNGHRNEWADLNRGAKGDYIYLTVHKTKFK